MPNKSRETANLVATSGVSTIRDLNATRVNVSGVGTITNGTVTNLTGTAGTVTTLRSTTLNADTGNIVTGVITNFTSTNGTITNLTGTSSTITTLRSTTGNFTTGNIVTGVTTIFNATNVVITGVTTVSAGTALLPSITPSGDPNTGVFFPSADHLNFSTGGTSRVQIESDGDINIDGGGVFYDATNNRVGIGVSSPDGALHVVGGGSTTSAIALNGSGGVNDNAVISATSSLYFQIDSNNNIGSRVFNWRVGGKGFSNGTSLMTLNAAGQLLVGTSASVQVYLGASTINCCWNRVVFDTNLHK